jgi:hypothetical protein
VSRIKDIKQATKQIIQLFKTDSFNEKSDNLKIVINSNYDKIQLIHQKLSSLDTYQQAKPQN